MEVVVSIIVPVYNAEKYIEKCVNSVLKQDYKKYELLLVDDGSTDNSPAILDEFARKDKRIRVIHKKNTGVSDTRNLALKEARGKYVQFMDADDWIPKDSTRLLVSAALSSKADMVIADFYRVVGKRVSVKGDIVKDGKMTLDEFASCMMENPADFYYGVLWNKLYKTEIIRFNNIFMNTEISWCEDFMFNLEYMRYVKTIYALNAPIYYYLKRKGSLVSQSLSFSKTIKMKLTVFEYYNNFYKHIFDDKEYEKNKRNVYKFFVDAASDGMVAPRIMPGTSRLGDEKTKIIKDAVKDSGLLMDIYRLEKILTRFLEPVAHKHDMEITDIFIILGLENPRLVKNQASIADLLRISKNDVNNSMQKLISKDFVKMERVYIKERAEKKVRFSLLPKAMPILDDIGLAINDLDDVIFDGFTDDEIVEYARLSEKMKMNISSHLI